jgi:predicted TIM-barrel fold metal-dependent hydrolase
VALLDQAGIRRALVLSIAYQFSNPNKPPVENEYARVKEENDWTAAQAGQYPERLRALCSVNPLKDYALQEIARCANNPQLHFGLKLHFGNSDVDLDSAADVAKVRTIFRSANEHGMAIVVHMRPSVTRRRAYGAKEARAFLTEILPAAPDVPVQIAHLAGAGGYDDPAVDAAAAVFVEAVANHDTRMKHVYFDVSGVAGLGKWKEKAGVIATRIRQLGVERLLFGSDGAGNGNLTPKEAWAAFRQLPLTQVEFHAIEQNITPYMR